MVRYHCTIFHFIWYALVRNNYNINIFVIRDNIKIFRIHYMLHISPVMDNCFNPKLMTFLIIGFIIIIFIKLLALQTRGKEKILHQSRDHNITSQPTKAGRDNSSRQKGRLSKHSTPQCYILKKHCRRYSVTESLNPDLNRV